MTTLGPTADISHEYISSRRIEGTVVLGSNGERLGEIHSVMLDKHHGNAAYVVVATSWFLGGTSRVVPVAWDLFHYAPDRHGYVVALTKEDLERAPAMILDEADRPVQVAQRAMVS